MRTDVPWSGRVWRRLGSAVVAALGIAAIVGSGGGFPDIDYDFDGPWAPSVSVEPAELTVQAGGTAVFSASAVGSLPLAYQWRRDGVDIAGARSWTYTLVGASAGDDGAQFTVVVSNEAGAATASGLLRVSPWPAVIVEDGDFALADWEFGPVLADPSTSGPVFVITREAAGGVAGAFRKIAFTLPTGPAAISVLQGSLPSTYDAAQQGPIYVIDFALACNRLSTTTWGETLARPVLEQAGRWFAPRAGAVYCAPIWMAMRQGGYTADEFELVAGPACEAGAACPDFSVDAAPIRFGVLAGVNIPAGSPAGSVEVGIDDWRVTVWRR
jgi:hypothetical protein